MTDFSYNPFQAFPGIVVLEYKPGKEAGTEYRSKRAKVLYLLSLILFCLFAIFSMVFAFVLPMPKSIYIGAGFLLLCILCMLVSLRLMPKHCPAEPEQYLLRFSENMELSSILAISDNYHLDRIGYDRHLWIATKKSIP